MSQQLLNILRAHGAPASREDMGAAPGAFSLLAQRLHDAKTPPRNAASGSAVNRRRA